MIYRMLGRTGLHVSQLGFGAMRLPMQGEGESARIDREKSTAMMHRAFEAGVNYIDTAVGYCNRDSQCAVGEALKGWREKIVLSTKNHYYGPSEKEWWQHLEDSLTRLQTDWIDIYNHHGINWKKYKEDVEPRVSSWMRKAQDQGLIRHICTSFHDDASALPKLIDTGYFSCFTVQYNLLNRDLEEHIAYAHDQGMGVVVMGPVGGGRLGGHSDMLQRLVPGTERLPDLAMRFVLANPNVTVALSGMSTMEQVEENISSASDAVSLSSADHHAIEEHLLRMRKMAELYCTGCRYCLPCPSDVNIPAVFEQYNLERVYGLGKEAKASYRRLMAKNTSATSCTECGACESKCPQNIPIIKQLSEAHKVLADGRRGEGEGRKLTAENLKVES